MVEIHLMYVYCNYDRILLECMSRIRCVLSESDYYVIILKPQGSLVRPSRLVGQFSKQTSYTWMLAIKFYGTLKTPTSCPNV